MFTRSVRNLSLTIATATIIMSSNCQASTQPNTSPYTDTLTINLIGFNLSLSDIKYYPTSDVDISGPRGSGPGNSFNVLFKSQNKSAYSLPSMTVWNEDLLSACKLIFEYSAGPAASSLDYDGGFPPDCDDVIPSWVITKDSEHHYSLTLNYY